MNCGGPFRSELERPSAPGSAFGCPELATYMVEAVRPRTFARPRRCFIDQPEAAYAGSTRANRLPPPERARFWPALQAYDLIPGAVSVFLSYQKFSLAYMRKIVAADP